MSSCLEGRATKDASPTDRDMYLETLRQRLYNNFITEFKAVRASNSFNPDGILSGYEQIQAEIGAIPAEFDLRKGIEFTKQLLDLSDAEISDFFDASLAQSKILMGHYQNLLKGAEGKVLELSDRQRSDLISLLTAMVADHYDDSNTLNELFDLLASITPESNEAYLGFSIDQRISLLTVANVCAWLRRTGNVDIEQFINAIFSARNKDLFSETLKQSFPEANLCQTTAEKFYDCVIMLRDSYMTIPTEKQEKLRHLRNAISKFSFDNINFA